LQRWTLMPAADAEVAMMRQAHRANGDGHRLPSAGSYLFPVGRRDEFGEDIPSDVFRRTATCLRSLDTSKNGTDTES
jgi:hypothetical protein